MKKTFTFIFSVLFIGATLSLTSCSKDDDNGGSSAAPKTEKISFKLNGTDFKVGTFIQDYDDANDYIELTANGNDQVTVLSMFVNTMGNSTLQVNDPIDASVNLQIGQDLYSGSNGTITITSIDRTKKTIEGTFSFEVSDFKTPETTFSITEGTYFANY